MKRALTIAGLTMLTFLSPEGISLHAQTVLPLPFSNRPNSNYTTLRLWAFSNQFTVYTSVSNADAKVFRGVFVPAASTSRIALHSDDGANVTIDGLPTNVSKKNQDTQLQNENSFDPINFTFVAGQEYCVQIDYVNGTTNVNDKDGVTLYAYDGGGSVADRPIIRSPRDAVCLDFTLGLTAECGGPTYKWTSSNTNLATVAGSGPDNVYGTVTGLQPGQVTITLTDTNNHSTALVLQVVKPGISPAFSTNCVGLNSTFVLTNAAGTGSVSWSLSDVLSANTRTNTLAFATPGTNVLSATYAGCIVGATVVVVAVSALLPANTNLCGNGTVVYTNQTTPPGFPQFVNWGGAGLTGTGGSRTNNYGPGVYVVSNWCGTSVQYSTTTVHHIDITQTGATLLAGDTTPVTFSMSGGNAAVTWQVNPGGGPNLSANQGAPTALLAGPTAGTYTLTACANALPGCCDTASVQVVRVAFHTNLVGVCEGGSALVTFTVQPTNYLGSITFDTVTNLATGPVNTHASVSVSGTNLTVSGNTNGTAWLRARLGSSFFAGPTLKIGRVTFPTNAWSVGVAYSTVFATTITPPDAPITYQSANPAIATVTGSGTNVTVTGVSNGTAQVRAYCGASGPCATRSVDVVSVTMTPSELSLCITQSGTLELTIVPAGAVVEVASELPAIATAVRNGNTVAVTAVAPGSTSIRATVNGSVVAISDVHCVRVTFATNDFYVAVANTNVLEVDVDPGYLAGRLTFASVNAGIASVFGGPDLLTVRGVTNDSTSIQAWAGGNQLCALKAVNVVQPVIASVEWRNLDRTAITNVNPNAGGGLRIFADRPTPSAPPENRVRLRARITPVVPFTSGIFLRVFDVDDPSGNTLPLDSEAGPDNRGTWAQLPATPIPVDSNGVAEAVFTVSTQPGDNFRAVAATDLGSFTGMAARQNDGVNATITNATGAVVPANQVTPLLTIWRRLHVEVDSMMAVPTNANSVVGEITSILGSTNSMGTQVVVSVNLVAGDSSANLDSGSVGANGRFENGALRIGPSSTLTQPIVGNGSSYFRATTFNLPFTLLNGGLSANGQIWNMNNSGANTLLGVWPPPPEHAFDGGTIVVAGTPFSVLANSGVTVALTVANASIAFAAGDDDDNSVLPGTVDTSDIAPRLAQVYILPLFDGGGSLAYNQTNVPFVANTESSSPYRSRSRSNNSDSYWVVYLVAAFQDSYPTMTLTADFDPQVELGTWASANNLPGNYGVLFYLESMRDGVLSAEWRARTTVHEIGHNFGLTHGAIANGPAANGIMHPFAPAPGGAAANYYFNDGDADAIRRVPRPN